ncbi:hypothetical protein [Streptomyces sp. NPDC001635]
MTAATRSSTVRTSTVLLTSPVSLKIVAGSHVVPVAATAAPSAVGTRRERT